MTNKRVDVNEFGACAKKMFGTLDVTKANMEAISATYNVCIPSKVKYAEVVSSDPIVRRIPVTEEVEAPERISATTAIEPLTDTELAEHQKAVSVTSIVAEAERTSAASLDTSISFIPRVDKSFVAWGNCGDIKRILKADYSSQSI